MGDGKVAAITGASRGIGRAIAQSLATSGYRIACLGRDAAALSETLSLVRATDGTATLHLGDLANEDVQERVIEEIVHAHGRLDVLVNNAGMTREMPACEMSVSDFRSVLEVNLVSYFALARLAYPYLQAQPSSVVVNIGSILGAVGVAGVTPYSASKAGVEGLTRALAVEWARDGIRVVCVAPGWVQSDINRDALRDTTTTKRVIQKIPQRRIAVASEVADVVAFVVGASASFMTGNTVVVDGGQLASA